MPSSLVVIVPSPSLSKREKASLNSAICSSVSWSAPTSKGILRQPKGGTGGSRDGLVQSLRPSAIKSHRDGHFGPQIPADHPKTAINLLLIN